MNLTTYFSFPDYSQNSVEDLYSLLKFLAIKPLNDWIHFSSTIARPVKAGRTSRAMKCLQVHIASEQVVNCSPYPDRLL